jgi:hypothetical protein
VRILARERVTVVALIGEHDLATLESVRDALAAAVARGGDVVVDLSPCRFIDCAVARALSCVEGPATRIVIGPATSTSVGRLLDLLGVPFTATREGIARIAALGTDGAT